MGRRLLPGRLGPDHDQIEGVMSGRHEANLRMEQWRAAHHDELLEQRRAQSAAERLDPLGGNPRSRPRWTAGVGSRGGYMPPKV
jgi:hypothetical protein